jgi:hypothetical protein
MGGADAHSNHTVLYRKAPVTLGQVQVQVFFSSKVNLTSVTAPGSSLGWGQVGISQLGGGGQSGVSGREWSLPRLVRGGPEDPPTPC